MLYCDTVLSFVLVTYKLFRSGLIAAQNGRLPAGTVAGDSRESRPPRPMANRDRVFASRFATYTKNVPAPGPDARDFEIAGEEPKTITTHAATATAPPPPKLWRKPRLSI
jgi:hypothetical protein